MRLFPDSPNRYYQDMLRTVGKFAEDHRFCDLRIIETEDGVVLQGRVELLSSGQTTEPATETYFFSVQDLLKMMRSAVRARTRLLAPAESKKP